MVETSQLAPASRSAEAPDAAQAHKLCIILSKGTLDMAYPAFMLAQTAAVMGTEVHVFFTFWGMNAIDKRHVERLQVSPVGNPGMPMPQIVAVLPGMTAIATRMMKGRIAKARVPPLYEMIRQCKDVGVQLHACSTTMQVMGVTREQLIPEVDDVVGAASFLAMAEGAQTLFI